VHNRVPTITAHPFLFAYGTLMRGFHEAWQDKFQAKLIGQGTIRGRLYDLGDYPGARVASTSSDDFVTGELYELSHPERAIRFLDGYEGYFPSEPHKSLFVRDLVTVTLQGCRKTRAWAYLYNRPVSDGKLIPSGNYRDRVPASQ
jgi:gamma-glutamylcyclotransferase (GGCT)/AIG2-like uncharacterized protein YtfP